MIMSQDNIVLSPKSSSGKINVLIFPCETNSNELHDALSYCFNVNVFGASSVRRHGAYIYKNYNCQLPLIASENFINDFNHYLDEYEIDVIMPTHDTVALFLAEHASEIHAKVVQSDVFTNKVCRSKIQTHDLFKDCDFVPIRFTSIEKVEYPAFAKPDIGEGSHGAFIANNKDQFIGIDFDKYLITEFLPGEELTVDCLTDKNGKLVCVLPRTRDRIFGGIAVNSKSITVNGEINNIANIINSRLSFTGLWYFQLRGDRYGKLKLMEISTRCAGTMCVSRARGYNLPLLSVYVAMGYDISVPQKSMNVEMDRALIARYDMHLDYDTVYIDFDDTITLRDEINPYAMFFLYQCHNKHVKVHLLTRHIHNIHESLKKHAVSEDLFTDIIYIPDNESKSSYITESKSIFIDNMYKERVEVAMERDIPVFDADGFEFLLDWRV